jgi:WD40 repeat protein
MPPMDDTGFPAQQKLQEISPEMAQDINGEEALEANAPVTYTEVNFARLESDVNTIAISPDGRRVIAGLLNGTLQLFDLMNGAPIGQPFQSHQDPVNSVAFSPDGQSIVCGSGNYRNSGDNAIRLWSFNGKLIAQPFLGHLGSVNSVAFSPDGQFIVSGSNDSTIRLWSLNGKLIAQPFLGHLGSVTSVAFSPDGKSIVSGSGGFDKAIRLWSLDGKLIGQPFQGHQDPVTSVAFSPDGQFIVSGSNDKTIRLWSLDGKLIGQPFQGHQDHVTSVAFSPDGKSIVSGSYDSTICLWSLDGKTIGQFFGPPVTWREANVNSVAFSPDGQSIVCGSGGYDTTIRLWSLDGKPIRNLEDRRKFISFPQGIANDLSQGDDQLKVKDEIDALATVLMLRSLQPPVAVGILGNWGSGKSFGMYLIQQKVNEIRSQSLTISETWVNPGDPSHAKVLSPYVGHIYQIQFNAWTYAKSNLWASLMQEIFYELNRQISLEQQLGRILSHAKPTPDPQPKAAPSSSAIKQSYPRYLNQFIYHPLSKAKQSLLEKIKLFSKLIYFLLKIIDLWLFQLFSHVFILLVILLFVILIFSTRSLNVILTKILKKGIVSGKIEEFFYPVFNWFNLEEQYTTYYFPRLYALTGTWRERFEFIVEYSLFFVFVGFPTRLSDRQKFWAKKLSQSSPSDNSESKPKDLSSIPKPNLAQFGKALREGGRFWKVLYLMSEEERNAFLKQELNAEQFLNWQALNTTAEISNSLWTALDRIKQEEQERLKTTEEILQNKEKELQRQLKSAEVEVDQRLSRRAGTALWTPLIHGLARLRFSKEEVQDLADKGKTFELLRKTIKSWQGVLALFLMGILIVVTTSPEGWDKVFALIQPFLKDSGLVNQLKPLIPTWVNEVPSWAKTTFQWMQKNIPTWFQIGTATIVALIPALKALGEYIASVQKEQACIQSERDGLLKQSQSTSESLSKEVAQLKLQVEEQRKKLGLTANYSSLLDFVNARLDGDDYGKHLGLMQQVKQDLAALSDRLTLGAHNQEELKKFFPRGPARVILYIDDLDRCPPNRVVEVLEAVQLLLNTKLFIVVLGIDDRYIARALEEVYRGVLKRRGKPSGIDYLEKIIQIPYRMRPISPGNVKNYLRAQLQTRKPSEAESTQPATQPNLQQPQEPIASVENGKTDENVASENIQPDSSTLPPDSVNSSLQDLPQTLDRNLDPSRLKDLDAQTSEPPTPDRSSERAASRQPAPIREAPQPTPTQSPAATPSPSYLETIAQVTEFDEADFKILVDCCKQVDITPRTAKRLINIYKILQIIWTTRSQKSQLQDLPSVPEKRVVMSFLALSGRYPTFMRNLFEEIDVLLEEQSLEESQECNADNPHIQKTLHELTTLIAPQISSKDVHARREWRKFEADIQRMLKGPTHPKEQPVELNIDRQTFELMLSFCFVGDIGYDPDDYSADVEPRDKLQ